MKLTSKQSSIHPADIYNWTNVDSTLIQRLDVVSILYACWACNWEQLPIKWAFPTILHVRAITKTRLFKYIEKFTTKNWKFSDKYSDIFHISAQNTDCGHSLEPPRRGGSKEYPQSMFLSRNK